jgi:dephospho-CoA kinase
MFAIDHVARFTPPITFPFAPPLHSHVPVDLSTEQNATRPKIRIVGLLGGVASGKSHVASLLGELGAVVLDADRAGHEVLEEPEVIAAARARWGSAVFSADGSIDRRAVGRIVFADSPQGRHELEFLEGLTHPRIGARLLAQVEAANGRGVPLAILDAAVMRKAGWDKFCDKIVMIDAPQEVRLARARSRGWTEAEFRAREMAQESLDEKRQLADFVIDNSGPSQATRAEVQRLWPILIGREST